MKLFGLAIIAIMISGCANSALQPPERPAATAANPQQKKQRGLVVTDNPYTISSDRLEQMNKGGFGGY